MVSISLLTDPQVCLSAIVIKSPGCSLAQSSLVELDRIKGAFARVTNYRVVHAQASNPKDPYGKID
jgi:hypothetical protein